MSAMTKAQALEHIAALYRTFNLADSDSEDRADWTTPQMAGIDGCRHLEILVMHILNRDEREVFYANL